jgi:hypothetical protein
MCQKIQQTSNFNNVIINKTKILLPHVYVTLAHFDYPA